MLSISKFRSLLESVESSFVTLSNAEVLRDIHNEIILHQSKSFVESLMLWRGELYAVAMPLSPQALAHSERLGVKLRMVDSYLVPQQLILRRELIYNNNVGDVAFADLLMTKLPSGINLQDFVARADVDHKRLYIALYQMEAELRRIGLVHHNLKSYNILVDPSTYRLYPLRFYYAQFSDQESDSEGVEYLANWIALHVGCNPLCREDLESRDLLLDESISSVDGFEWVGNPFEGLRCVRSHKGYGFIDSDNRVVVEPNYLWASDFREGRAEIKTHQGMGIIDRQGCNIVEPIYEIAEFDSDTTRIVARLNGERMLFDYNGILLCDS